MFLGGSSHGTLINKGRGLWEPGRPSPAPVLSPLHCPAESGWWHFKFTLYVLYAGIKDGTKWQRMRLGEGKPFPK